MSFFERSDNREAILTQVALFRTNHRSPLFVKLVFLAVATLTSDSALMITVDRLAARLTDVRFSLEFTRLSALNKLYHVRLYFFLSFRPSTLITYLVFGS